MDRSASNQVKSNPDVKIWRIAGPSITSNISGAVIGLVDAWAVGHLSGDAPLAGLAVGSFIMVTVYMLFSFFYMSTVGLVAQAVGAKDERRTAEVMARAIALAVVLGVIIITLSKFIVSGSAVLWELNSDAARQAEIYLQIRLFSTPSIFIKMCVSGFLIGKQRAKTALALDLFLNALNVLLTFWFVVGLDKGIGGAAWGNLIAESAAAIAGLVAVLMVVPLSTIRELLKERQFWKLEAFRSQIVINTYLFLRMIIIQVVFSILSTSGSRFGENVLAGNHLLLQMVLVVSLSLAGVGSATQALVGAAIGARDPAAVRFWSLRTAFWCAVVGALYAVGYAVFGTDIIAWFTEAQKVRDAAFEQMPMLALWPLVAIFSYQMDAIFIAATAGKYMMISACAAAIVFVAAAALLVPDFGNRGLWVAFTLFFACRAASLGWFYHQVVAHVRQAKVSQA